MGCECNGTCGEPSGLNLEGLGIWVEVALHKVEELKSVSELNKLNEGILFLGNALQNISFLLGRGISTVEDRREGN